MTHKTTFYLIAAAVGYSLVPRMSAGGQEPATDPPMLQEEEIVIEVPAPVEPLAPVLSHAEQVYLIRHARKTMEALADRKGAYKPDYIPSSLRNRENHVIVRLRQHGRPQAFHIRPTEPITEAVRNGAQVALRQYCMQEKVSLNHELVNEIIVEIEVAGNIAPTTLGLELDSPDAIAQYFEPGRDGAYVEIEDDEREFWPSAVITENISVTDALLAITADIADEAQKFRGTVVGRFRSAHFMEVSPGGEVIQLFRGVTVVEQEEVSAEGLDAAIDKLASYVLFRRRRHDGYFEVEYQPHADKYTDDRSEEAQMIAAWSLAVDGRLHSRSASTQAAESALDRVASRVLSIGQDDSRRFVATPDRRNPLGVTALFSIVSKQLDGSADVSALINAIIWLQSSDGKLATIFPPARWSRPQTIDPGQALLALAIQYEADPRKETLDAVDRAFSFYSKLFQESPDLDAAGWQIPAFSIMARLTRRTDYADYVFSMTDAILAKQRTPDECRWPELFGGIASHNPVEGDAATALYLRAVIDAWRLAEFRGDKFRSRKYENAAKLAVRFVIQLMMRPGEAWFVQSRGDAVGGIRHSMTDPTMRVEHSAHALLALIDARHALFGPRR
jgi:AMMECR1 domain-containing protein